MKQSRCRGLPHLPPPWPPEFSDVAVVPHAEIWCNHTVAITQSRSPRRPRPGAQVEGPCPQQWHKPTGRGNPGSATGTVGASIPWSQRSQHPSAPESPGALLIGRRQGTPSILTRLEPRDLHSTVLSRDSGAHTSGDTVLARLRELNWVGSYSHWPADLQRRVTCELELQATPELLS